MARTATAHLTYSDISVAPAGTRSAYREYVVGERRGQVRRTLGRVMGGNGGNWAALPVGASAWTRWHSTRTAAVEAMIRREDFRTA